MPTPPVRRLRKESLRGTGAGTSSSKRSLSRRNRANRNCGVRFERYCAAKLRAAGCPTTRHLEYDRGAGFDLDVKSRGPATFLLPVAIQCKSSLRDVSTKGLDEAQAGYPNAYAWVCLYSDRRKVRFYVKLHPNVRWRPGLPERITSWPQFFAFLDTIGVAYACAGFCPPPSTPAVTAPPSSSPTVKPATPPSPAPTVSAAPGGSAGPTTPGPRE
jgi:hypothetical protein